MKLKTILFSLGFLLSNSIIFSQVKTPVKWSFNYKTTTSEIVIKATMEDKWHIYSQKQAGDGPLPTVFIIKPNESYKMEGDVVEPIAVKQHSEVFGSEVMSFSKEVVFVQKIKRISSGAFKIEGEVEFMSCNDVSCLPPKTVPFVLEIEELKSDGPLKPKAEHTE